MSEHTNTIPDTTTGAGLPFMTCAMAGLVPTCEMGNKEEGTSDPAPQAQPNTYTKWRYGTNPPIFSISIA